MATTLGELFRHNRWANERMLEACRDLSDEQRARSVEGTYGELGYTLIHIVRAESWYLKLLTGWEPPVRWEIPGPWPGIEVLLDRARFTGDRLCEIADQLDPAAVLETGEDKVPTSVVLVQAINHATEHRAQAATILTQLGIEPPPVDGWNFGESGG
ncbi:MAG: DinB family protein [Chloroflexota bacterium]